MRLPRPWTKKRGSRLLGGAFSGAIGEAMFLAGLFLLGVFALALALFQRYGRARFAVPGGLPEGLLVIEMSTSLLGFWIIVVIATALILIGGVGLAYRLLRIGTSDERRNVFASRAAAIGPTGGDITQLPAVPGGRGATESPGLHQTYRLANDGTDLARGVIAVAALALLWNATWFVLLAVVVSGFLHGRPRWVLGFLLIPFAGIGWWALRYFFDALKRSAGVGATIVEINDHPLQPGGCYTLFVRQAGRLKLRRLRVALVCDEQSTYRQGTDLQVDSHRVLEQIIHTERDLTIDPHRPWLQELQFSLPQQAMHSFQSANNAVCWKITVSGDARPWPSFCRSFPVIVHPPVGPPRRHPR